MQNSIRYALIGAAAIAAGLGLAAAGTKPPPAHPQQAAQQPGRGHGHGRAGGRFLFEYDLNHDGKVTRDEFNKVTAQRFAEATGRGKTMNEKQFEGFRTRSLHQHVDQNFRRADWNGDGKLSFDEFANPIRASFERADRQSTGVVLCRSRNSDAGGSASGAHRSRRGGGSRGAGAFCARDDLNHDGKVTRAELDQALHQQFAAAAKGGAMSKDQFESMQHSRAETTSSRAFERLDDNHDGKLTLQEFSAYQQRTFARMDRNNDGVITQDEMASRRSASRPRSRT